MSNNFDHVLVMLSKDLLSLMRARVKEIRCFNEVSEELEDRYKVTHDETYKNFKEAFNAFKKIETSASVEKYEIDREVNVERTSINVVYALTSNTFKKTKTNKELLTFIVNMLVSLS